MTATVRGRPMRAVHPAVTCRLPRLEQAGDADLDGDAEQLRLWLDDIPIPSVSLDVDGLRPTIGMRILGLFDRFRGAR